MRNIWTAAAVVVACLTFTQLTLAKNPGCAMAAPACTDGCGAGACGMGDFCDPCHGRGSRFEGLDAHFNCGCNGSYKFPIPPLYTYHWPGMYSAQLMTEYHSPWRFPPLKPYSVEVPPVEMGSHGPSLGRLRTVSASTAIELLPADQPESMSSKLLRGR